MSIPSAVTMVNFPLKVGTRDIWLIGHRFGRLKVQALSQMRAKSYNRREKKRNAWGCLNGRRVGFRKFCKDRAMVTKQRK